MIDTREELINALSEAAELEHGLLVQYLFAALTLKRREDEGLTKMQQLLVTQWERDILAVGHQEMYHLANVCNLLAAIGGAPHFSRPNFPQSMSRYYPFDFELEKFSDNALYRFIVFELPEGEPLPDPPGDVVADSIFRSAGPDPLVYNRIGELYRKIEQGFKSIPESELFIGPKSSQDIDRWTLRLNLFMVRDRASALKAIDEIVKDGEGSAGNRQGSHYDMFLKIRQAYLQEKHKDASFEPARPVVKNPQTREHRAVSGEAFIISHPVSLHVAEWFNTIYTTMLLMLLQYYSYGTESKAQRELLRDSSRRLMSSVIRPVIEVLSELPASEQIEYGNAGPGFELYGPLSLATDAESRWIILKERFANHQTQAGLILNYSGEYPVLERVELILEALRGTLMNLTNEFHTT